MKPDIASFLGVIIAILSIIVGQHLEGGHLSSIMQITAFLIVIGGTIGATMLQYPLYVSTNIVKKIIEVFMGHEADMPGTAKKILELANISRKEGVLALQGQLDGISDPFFKKALQFVVDGTEENALRDMLETDIATQEGLDEEYVKWLEAAGGYAPTVGILGAVLGLIHVMENLDKPESLGSGIAVAFVATVYGVGFANLFFLPCANKLKGKSVGHGKGQILVIEGVIGILRGENPNQLKEKLRAYLQPKDRASLDEES